MKQEIPFKKKLRMRAGDVVYWAKTLRKKTKEGFRVLAYHSITDIGVNEWEESTIPKSLFESQMKHLADNAYNVIRCSDAAKYLKHCQKIPPRTVAITFDDGYRDNYTNALPVLKKYNFCATIFLTVNFLQDKSGDLPYLSYSEIEEIKKCSIIDFGAHGLSHRSLATLDKEELYEEIVGAKQNLEKITGRRIDLFAYPYGHSRSFSKKIIELVRQGGFEGAFTTIFGINDFKINCFLMRRNRISWLDTLDEFNKHLIGAYDWCAWYECFRYKRHHL